ncbi:C6 zinc finger domain protein [Ilyonectria sp. MPI-CAGE-AT-0026]|nr:C6 zinc finger domain protein [Ilyonectria sp. MPI-CAGE-AT-0026]
MTPQPRRRRRPALSCSECRRRKIRCDHNNPCAHCVRQNAQCVFSQLRNPSGASSVRESTASQRPLRSPAPALAAAAARDVPTPVSISVGRSGTRSLADHGGADVTEILHRIRRLEDEAAPRLGEQASARAFSEADRESVSRPPPAGYHEWQIVLNKSRDLGKSRWMGSAQTFSTILSCYKGIVGTDVDNAIQATETSLLHIQAGELLRKCKDGAKTIKVGRPSRSSPATHLGILPLSREVADAMVDLYFASFESTHRILHGPTFRMQYDAFWNQPGSAPMDLRHQVLLVIGIGSSLQDHGDRDAALCNVEMVRQWIFAAQTWLAGPLEKDRLTIAGLQIYCLTILARQIFSVGGDLIWVSMGSLVHEAMQMGLNRDPDHLPAMSVLQAEVRRRLWATILELAVQSSLDSWMPTRISLDEFNTKPPSNVNDEDMDKSTMTLLPHPQDTFTATSIQLAILASLPVRLRIVQLLNGMHSDLSYPKVLALSSELSEALRKCSSLARDSNGKCTVFHRNLLDYLVRRFMIPLHLSFNNQAEENPLFHYSLKISFDAAMATVTPEPDAAFHRLMVTGAGLFREGIRYAIMTIGHELLSLVEVQRQDGTLHRTGQHRDVLKQTVRDMIALSAERIQLGETNVKSHMFLSMVLAQVEALETDGPVDVQVARAAKESLGFCHDILVARAANAQAVSVATTPGAEAELAEEFDVGRSGLEWDWEPFLPHSTGSQWASYSDVP